jgi:hypothetical protein
VSTELYTGQKSGLHISRYAGPEISWSFKEEPCTADRRRYQITNNAGMLVTLSRCEWLDLAAFFTADCGAECEGPHGTGLCGGCHGSEVYPYSPGRPE